MIFEDTIDSKLLSSNPAGESSKRPVKIYLPDQGEGKGPWPVVYYLSPWLRRGLDVDQWAPFRESFMARLDRLIKTKKIKPVVLVCPDLWTRFGGSQYVDSSYFGPHGRFLREELPEWAETHLPIKKGARHRAVIGKSSGGFGALRLALDHPGWSQATAALAPDAGFDLLYSPAHFAKVLEQLGPLEEGLSRFLETLFSKDVPSKYFEALMLLGNGLFYSPGILKLEDFIWPFDANWGISSLNISSFGLITIPLLASRRCRIEQTLAVFCVSTADLGTSISFITAHAV